MDKDQEILHLNILNNRVAALRLELELIQRDGLVIDQRFQAMKEGLQTIESNRRERLEGIHSKYESELNDYQRQIGLAEEMLNKKQEERQALLGYLRDLHMDVSFPDDLKDFDWDTATKIVASHNKKKDDIFEQNKKAEILYELNHRAKLRLDEINELLSMTSMDKDRLQKSVKEFSGHTKEWQKISSLQSDRIFKIQNDNERLNALIRHCIVSNEPMSNYVTKNIHAKCTSFIYSNNAEELKGGLMKFRARQERIIKLLRYKENQLGDQANKLQVARDQTIDQMRYYKDLISEARVVMGRAGLLNSSTKSND